MTIVICTPRMMVGLGENFNVSWLGLGLEQFFRVRVRARARWIVILDEDMLDWNELRGECCWMTTWGAWRGLHKPACPIPPPPYGVPGEGCKSNFSDGFHSFGIGGE